MSKPPNFRKADSCATCNHSNTWDDRQTRCEHPNHKRFVYDWDVCDDYIHP